MDMKRKINQTKGVFIIHTASCSKNKAGLQLVMLNAHLPTGSRQLAISPTGDWKSVFVGRCVPNADPIVGANRRYSADSKFESALEPVGAGR